jgi:hypothetical protein
MGQINPKVMVDRDHLLRCNLSSLEVPNGFMTVSPISKLPKNEREDLLHDLNYLNTSEIKSFCKGHSIPYKIVIETKNGRRRATKDVDRKGVILGRIRHFIETGVILKETIFPAGVVCFDPFPKHLTANHRLFYGQYDKTNPAMIHLLKDLTDGQFENGATARIVARDFWSRGKAPTFREYATAWLRAVRLHTEPNPEWAFLSDRANKMAIKDWKKFRAEKASKLMKVLDQMTGEVIVGSCGR